MNLLFRLSICTLIVLSQVCNSKAQEINFTKKYKENTIHTLSQLMNDFYVFPEVAKKTEIHLLQQLKDGHFDQFTSNESFAEALTISVQSINHDKHMRIAVKPPYEAPEQSPERTIEEQLHNLNRVKTYNNGFHTAKVMEGNIGYIDLRGFAGLQNGKDMADAYMKLIANTDAVIIDLSKNGGGDPAMVQYLCSYFFDSKVHLNSLYFREGDQTMDFYTLDDIDGTKMPDIPLFILTSEKTFSGAEEFSYNMQTQKRATLVGQTTGGGANPGRTREINDKLTVFVPGGMAINPITKTNWEGVGVVPEINTEVGKSLDKAHELAKVAADKYRAALKDQFTTSYMKLFSHMDIYTKDVSEESILNSLQECSKMGLIQEWQINALGYEYLMQHKKPKIALCIFRANTMIHTQSANVYDSYAEALMMDGQLKKSQDSYQTAVDLAIKNGDENLELFKENLQNVKDMIAKKK